MMFGRSTIHQKNLLVFAVFGLVLLPVAPQALGSLAVGAAIQVANLHLLERSVARMLGGAASGLGSLVQLRMLALLGVVGYLLLTLRLEPIPFLLGLSTVVPAALWHGLTPIQEAS